MPSKTRNPSNLRLPLSSQTKLVPKVHNSYVHSPPSNNWVLSALISIFWLLIMAFPFIFIEVKLGLGVVLIVLAHVLGGKTNYRFDFFCLAICLLNLTYLYVPYLIGTYNESSFEYLFPLHVVFIVFWWFLLRLYTEADIDKIAKTAIVAGWVSWFYAMALLLSGLGVIPYEVPDVYSTVNVNSEIIELASNFVSALLFTSPIISYYYLRSPTPVSLVKLLLFWLGIIATGRRSAFFGLFICIVFVALESAVSFRRVVLGSLVALVVTSILVVAYAFDFLSLAGMIDERIKSLNFQDEVVRVDQARALWEGFLDRPFFGSGLGSSINIVRDEEKIWRYELSYIAALFRFGMVGCFAYFCLYGLPMLNSLFKYRYYSIAQKSLIIAVLSQVLAYALNPVFDTFDTAWQPLVPMLLLFNLYKRIGREEANRMISINARN